MLQVLVLLFLLMTVFPNSVFLNRGNHEDFGLCCVYGFQKECLDKYNDVVFRYMKNKRPVIHILRWKLKQGACCLYSALFMM